MSHTGKPVLVALLLTLPAAALLAPAAAAIDCTRTSTGLVPINDLGAGAWMGAQGGLYPAGSNERPAFHSELGKALARLAVPRNAAGSPDPLLGKSVFLSIGMSNTRNEFGSFVPLANADPMKHKQVVVVNGAIGGMDARRIADPLHAIMQILKVHFPNLWLVYASSRIYAGYATTALNPEPYAYGSAWSVKWLVESQLNGTFALQFPDKGVLAPWLSWGPYLWADGLAPRGDGLVWLCTDFAADGTHPNIAGSRKVAQLLLDFVHTDPTAQLWYRYAGVPPAGG